MGVPYFGSMNSVTLILFKFGMFFSFTLPVWLCYFDFINFVAEKVDLLPTET